MRNGNSPYDCVKLPQTMPKLDLPIFEIEQSLLETLTKQKRLVITAPTGSGKSTQVPQMLLDGARGWGWGRGWGRA